MSNSNDKEVKRSYFRGGLNKKIYEFLASNGFTADNAVTTMQVAEKLEITKEQAVATLAYLFREGKVTHPKRSLWVAVENVTWKKRGRPVPGGDSSTLRSDILNLLNEKPGLTLRGVLEALPGRRAQSVATIVSILKKDGLLVTEGTARTFTYRTTSANSKTVAA